MFLDLAVTANEREILLPRFCVLELIGAKDFADCRPTFNSLGPTIRLQRIFQVFGVCVTMSDAVATTEAVFQAKLTVEAADGKASTYVLAEGDSFTIGALVECDIRVYGENVAMMHCIIGVTGEKVWLRDCYSPGGTLVNGSRITETTVTPKDEIRIGCCCLLLNLGGSSDQVRPNRVSPLDSSQVSEEVMQVPASAGESKAQETQASDAPKPSFEISNHETVQEEPGPAVGVSGNIQLRQEIDQALAEIVELRGQLKKQRAQQHARSATEASDLSKMK